MEVHVCVRPCFGDVSALPQLNTNSNINQAISVQSCMLPTTKVMCPGLSAVTLIRIILFLIFGDRKGEEGKNNRNCLCNLPLLTKLEVFGYSL